MQEFDHISIEALNLSRRIYHALVRGRVLTIGDLRQFFQNKDRIQIRNIGEKSLDEISKALEEMPNNSSLLSHAKNESVQLNYHEDKWERKTIQSPIEVLNLPAAIRGMLKKHGINTVEDLRKTPNSSLLRVNLIGPKQLMEINRLLDEFVDNFGVIVVKEPVAIVEKKIITWSQVVEDYFRNEKDVYSYILISRFGYIPKTLEEIAAELGVTRERVRQIQEAVAIRYLKHIQFSGGMELLNKIENIFSTHADDLSLTGFEIILKREGILDRFSEPITKEHIRKLDLLETLICWLNLLSNKRYTLQPIEFSVGIFDLVRAGNISIRDRAAMLKISSKQRRQIKRKVLFTGGITVKEAVRILSTDERVTTLALESLNFRKLDKEWFSFKDLDNDKDNSKIPLRLAGLKMLTVNPETEIGEFHEGLRRHASRFYPSIAPLHVIKHLLPMLGFEIKNSKVTTQLSTKGILSQSEKSLVATIEKNSGVASFLEIAEEFFLRKLSLPAVSATLKRSPIVEKADDGLYKLRGTDISWQQIEDAKKRQKRFSQDDEVTHGLDGVVRMRFTVNSYAFLTGVVGANSIKELLGSWSVVHDGKSVGEAKIDDVYLWGLSKLFKKLDVKMGERLELALNTWNRTLSVEKVKNEHA
jgi:hypothetical protein